MASEHQLPEKRTHILALVVVIMVAVAAAVLLYSKAANAPVVDTSDIPTVTPASTEYSYDVDPEALSEYGFWVPAMAAEFEEAVSREYTEYFFSERVDDGVVNRIQAFPAEPTFGFEGVGDTTVEEFTTDQGAQGRYIHGTSEKNGSPVDMITITAPSGEYYLVNGTTAFLDEVQAYIQFSEDSETQE